MADATQELIDLLNDYSDPVGSSLHAELRKEYVTASVKQLAQIKRLLEQGADWKAGGRDDAAFTAAFFNDPRPLELLLDHGVPVEHRNKERGNDTLLHHAASFGRQHVVAMLAERGASVLAVNEFGRTPLDAARAWKHGKDALPLLTRLTKAAAKATPPTTHGDLHKKAMLAALKKHKGRAGKRIEKLVKAHFAVIASSTWQAFLTELASQDDDEVIGLGVVLVAATTTATPTTHKAKKGSLQLVHHGDVVVGGDCDATAVLATGSLTVKGRLTNWEGRPVVVGGSLTARALVTEGPLHVQGDAMIKDGVLATYNDYRMCVVGTTTTPVLVQDNHVVKLGKAKIDKHYRTTKAVPTAEAKRLNKLLGVKLG